MNLNLTLFGQSITFIIFVWFCWKYIWPPLIEAMRERQKLIADGLSAAENAEKRLAEAHADAGKALEEAKVEAQQIIAQARAQAAQMVEDAKTTAREEGDRLKEAANAELAQDVNRAKETLRSQVAVLAVSGAEQILESSIDADQHSALLDRLAGEL